MDEWLGPEISELTITTSLYAFLFAVSFPWLWIRRKLHPIKNRCWELTVLSHVGYILVLTSFTIQDCAFAHGTPCWIWVYLYPVFYSFYYFSILIRAYVLWFKYNTSYLINAKTYTRQSFFYKNRWTILLKNQFYYVFALALFFIIIQVVILVFTDTIHNPVYPPNYCRENADSFFQYSIIVLLSVLGITLIILLWRVEDSYQMKHEITFYWVSGLFVEITVLLIPNMSRRADLFLLYTYRYLWLIVGICCPVYLSYQKGYQEKHKFCNEEDVDKTVLVVDNKPSPINHQTSSTTLQQLEMHIIVDHNTVSDTHLLNCSTTIVEGPQEIDISKASRSLYNYVLATPSLLAYFQAFCVKSWCVESLALIFEIREFKLIESQPLLDEKAKEIWKEYFCLSGLMCVNVSHNVRVEIEEYILKNHFPSDMFDRVEEIMHQTLLHEAFFKWFQKDFSKDYSDFRQGKLADLSPGWG
eukprot:Lithocolla_globosa_v1_NODE_1074_length_2895_cov_15.340845.p1 type:complete len:471 gc:universal NODE_1074_length_2895_cov_15.340845:1453-41(-)